MTDSAFDRALEEIGRGRHVSLTTYRRDGRAVATALWLVVDGGELFMLTSPSSGKVKRLRNNGSVVIARCDARGRIAEGAQSANGTARLLDEAESARIHALMARRYVAVRLVALWERLRGRQRPRTGIAVTP